ncbi:peptidase C65 Otubain-domain-containing protein [Entophlyctis helioformis]|nr:peptidase C65 Otubain-domain-containing protein [Entophlyctis helioformis]
MADGAASAPVTVSVNAADRPSDEAILSYEREIKQAQMQQPTVGDLVDFSALEEEYMGANPIFLEKIHHLKQTSNGIRNIRKDGNCFYRAFAYRLSELLFSLRDKPWYTALHERASATKELMNTSGYDLTFLEDYYEVFMKAVTIGPETTPETMMELFRSDYEGEMIVWFLRFITAAHLKQERDMYEAFVLDSYPSLDMFIRECVEPMCVESDQIHIVAMANIFGVQVNVGNLDTAKADQGINYHEISSFNPLQVDNPPVLTLLYRPGHYDILYPASDATAST